MTRISRWFLPRSLLPLVAVAGGTLPASAVTAGPCDAAEFRQFDFWLGDWDVRTPDGQLAGRNRIEREQGGCVLHERYSTERGYAGESFNIYDATRRVWHQTWVDNTGLLLLLDGGLRDGSMVLEGPGVDGESRAVRHRITWTPQADGRVRQLWETTDAAGRWATAFDGMYARR
jgi:hypothetical protein